MHFRALRNHISKFSRAARRLEHSSLFLWTSKFPVLAKSTTNINSHHHPAIIMIVIIHISPLCFRVMVFQSMEDSTVLFVTDNYVNCMNRLAVVLSSTIKMLKPDGYLPPKPKILFQLKKDFGDRVPDKFPPKKLLTLSQTQLEERREQLEKYLQAISQDSVLVASKTFVKFLLKAQQVSRWPEKWVTIHLIK